MPLGADDMQPAQGGHSLAKHDVGAATGHVGGDRHRARLTGLRNDLRLHLMKLRIQYVMHHALPFQHIGQRFRLGDRSRPHQYRLSFGVQFGDFINRRLILGSFGLVNDIREIGPHHRAMGRNHDDIQCVDLAELLLLGLGSTGHAGQFFVHAEIVLEGDRGQRLALTLDFYAFLGLDRLMQTVGIAPAKHQPAGELVNDDDFAVFHHIVLVAVHQRMRPQSLIEMMRQFHVFVFVKVFYVQRPLGFGDARLGRRNRVQLLVDREIFTLTQLGHDLGQHIIKIGRFFAGPGNDQRRPRFIDQDRVHFVDDRVMQRSLHHLFGINDHVVAQIVKAEFIVRAVSDIGGISRFSVGKIKTMRDQAYRQAEEPINLTHPFAVAFGQIIVHRHQMHALAFQCIQVDRQRRHQRLAFTCFHLGDLAFMQRHTAEQLHIKMPHAGCSQRSLPHHGKRFRQQQFQRFAVLQTLPELDRLGCQ